MPTRPRKRARVSPSLIRLSNEGQVKHMPMLATMINARAGHNAAVWLPRRMAAIMRPRPSRRDGEVTGPLGKSAGIKSKHGIDRPEQRRQPEILQLPETEFVLRVEIDVIKKVGRGH